MTAGRLSGKVAIVTGGGGGFGSGIVHKFVQEGAKVVVVDILPSIAIKLVETYPQIQVVALQADVSSEADWARVLGFTIDTFQHLDIVVNNAGVNPGAYATIDTPEDGYDRMMRINLKALYYSTKGVFVTVSSISASRPRPGAVWYAASKAALTTASKGLALEWAAHGIRFNVVQPVLGDTPMGDALFSSNDTAEERKKALETIPLGRLATPADIGNTVAWLASDEATMLTGAVIDVDGGRGI
ncbi:3-ketoacyl-reductase [Aspergillus keveii]|uniref:3-ketoacyl-reductase n=1 Tax=Aspergillus keveii TaxID=714993 RepID=A0ABR4FRT3_9EURO